VKQHWSISIGLALIFASCCTARSANAEAYPTKPIHILVGYAPGGAVDIITRIIGAQLEKSLGQQIVVDNRPGSGTMIALQTLAHSPPDGYTLMMADIAFGAMPAIRVKLPYHTFRDFEPVGMVAILPGIMAVQQSLPVNTVKDFVALAKSEPGKLNYASAGLGSLGNLGPELFKAETGTDIVQIPYQSGAEGTEALLSGVVQMLFATAPPVLPFVGKMRFLAVSAKHRLPSMPDVPTFAQAGFPGVQVQLWEGLFAPVHTDPKVIEKLNGAVNAVLAHPDIRKRIIALGGEAEPGTPADLTKFLHTEVAKWKRVVPASMRIK
jgi:tripartite-type tricarboxylate transporter receptor subunit TctC